MFLNKFILMFAFSSILLAAGENVCLSTIAHALEVGVGTVDITPPLGMPMRGYASRKELSNGIWDPLYAKSNIKNA
ncbi:MAG: hypothetical protein RQ760_08750 [Sedimentisphaerales bacterium]|nr:hypothetical protein [Sedimentisphaerales bacterium]